MVSHDGIAPVSVLAVAGHSRRTLERALDHGAVQRVRKGWVALASADPVLVAAAERGVVLTCVTQAKRAGLFVLHEPRETHVAARPHSGRAGMLDARVHWAKPLVPRHPESLVDSIENTLALIAGCLPHEEALVVWESAFRTAQADPHTMARYSLPVAARRILDIMSTRSASRTSATTQL
ncbi:hypothetical protein [Microbacterium yannicii]|uniref:hypothetical protein n=1 Tax=Microbacterium yannicii TaxID=671622 RepID=UPI00035D980C|nr:hypothetical protein [Microbacterium yannicii]